MSKVNRNTILGFASGACLALASTLAPTAQAQIIPDPPTQECGTTTPGGTGNICTVASGARVLTGSAECGYERNGTGCQANDFIATASVTSNTILSCNIGDSVPNQSLIFTIQSSSSTRYAPGLFIGEQSFDMSMPTPNGDSCTVVTFPTTNTETPARVPFPWFAANNGDTCGSYSPNFTSTEEVDGITIACEPGPDGIHPAVNFMIVYAQNAQGAAACTGPGNVQAGTTSKCGISSAPISNVTITYSANPTCSLSGTGDGLVFGNGTFTKTFTITNNGPDDAGQPGSNAVSFDDPVPAPFVVTNAVCGNVQGGAVCPASVTVNGNDVSGTFPTLPNGASADITITGTYPDGDTSMFTNTVTLSVDDTIITPPAEWANTCDISNTLPVKLQSFDVK